MARGDREGTEGQRERKNVFSDREGETRRTRRLDSGFL